MSHADKVRMELDAAAMDVSELFAKVARAEQKRAAQIEEDRKTLREKMAAAAMRCCPRRRPWISDC